MACWAIKRRKITQNAYKICYRTATSYDFLVSLAIQFLHKLFSFFTGKLGTTNDEVSDRVIRAYPKWSNCIKKGEIGYVNRLLVFLP